MIALFVAAMLAPQPVCAPPPGTDALLNLDKRIIVVGENHGTAEAPAAFAQMVCAASQRGPVTVALELPESMQPQIDQFLAASDDATAFSALAGTPFLDPKMNDGRTSQAMLMMLNSVRALKAAGRDVALHAFQPSLPRPRELIQAWYEMDMGHLMAQAVYARPEAKVLALVGNLHAMKTAHPRFADVGLPAAGHLPTDDTVTLNIVQQGGTAWNCQAECRVHDTREVYDADVRGVVLEPYAEGAYDGVLALGPSTASPPIGVGET